MTAFIVGYMRYSSEAQAMGSSEARQADGYAGAVKMTGLTAWHKVYIDRGASGYFGEHLEGQFGALLRDVEARVFPAGSVIWFEAVDRMTRQGNEAAARYSRIITSNGYGLQFGTGQIRTEDTGEMETVGDVVLSMAAREYSKLLQKRLLKANQEKRDKGTTHLTKHKVASKACPSWLTPLSAPDANGYWFAFNDRAPIIREACRLSTEGMGTDTIRRHLGLTGKEWGGLRTILQGSTGLYGMRTNCKKGKVKQGMTACYPPLISEAEFYAMKQAQRDRARNLGAHGGGGRGGQFATCLFTGRLFYTDGSPMTLTSQGAKCKPVLKPVRMKKVADKEYTRLDNGTCELTLLAMIGSEVSASDLFPRKQTSHAELRVKEIEGQIVILQSKIDTLTEEFLSETGSAGIAKLISASEAKIETLKAEREKAIVEVRSSRNDVLSQTKDLLVVLDSLTGEELLTARTLLKNTLIPALVKSVHIDVRSAHDATYTITLVSGAKWTGDSSGWKGGEVAVMAVG